MTHESDAPLIKFPCADYPVKIIGRSAPDFREFVLKVVKKHDPQHNGHAEIKKSRNNHFEAVNVWIHAIGEAQIKALYLDLKDSGRVKMVL